MKKIILFALLAVALAGCRSHRRAAQEQQDALSQTTTPSMSDIISTTTTTTTTTEPTTTTATPRRNTSVEALQARLNMTLRSGNKSINLGGTMRLKRGDVVQLNLVYTVLILPVNVGTLELTESDILVLDRIGKRYCRVPYSDVEQFKKYGIDFAYLEDFFWGDGETKKGSQIGCTYDSWTNLSQGRFPSGLTLTLISTKKKATAVMELSNIEETSKWKDRTTVGIGYTQVSLDTVIQALISASANL